MLIPILPMSLQPLWPTSVYSYRPPGLMHFENLLSPVLVTVELGDICYPNCDSSTTSPSLNHADFTCFMNAFTAGEEWANCDGSTTPPVLNIKDMTCFLNKFSVAQATCPIDAIESHTSLAPLPIPLTIVHGTSVGSNWTGAQVPTWYSVYVWPDSNGVVEINTGRLRATISAHLVDFITSRDVIWSMPGATPLN